LAKARECLGIVGLEDRADEIVGDMSFGDQKLVAIARLLATGCEVLLLDEPTSGVDPDSVEEVIKVVRGLRDMGRTICLIEHSVHLIGRLADSVVFLDQGRVLALGTMGELTCQKELTEIYFGT
jgi:branched-chain amino acid transport system permease protein